MKRFCSCRGPFLSNLFLFIIFFLGSSAFSHAQFYQYGQPPSDLNWEKIESNHFLVIYPEEIRNEAKRTLIILERNYFRNSNPLGHNPEKVPIILHNHTVVPNGFAMWAPKRSEFFTTPDVNPVAHDWLTHLSLHEFRHIVQMDKLNQGTTKVLSYVLGEMGIGPAIATIPFWFLEGDAVYAETELSHSGRGRTPEFEMGIKANLIQDEKIFSFSKSYLGSFKDHVPSYYEYGYQMVSYAREKHGNDFWNGALNLAGKHPYLINPFGIYMRRNAGISKGQLYDSTMSFLKDHWEKQIDARGFEEYEPVNKPANRVFTSYNFPLFTEDGSIIAVKSGLHILDRFVMITSDGIEKTLFVPGSLFSGRISYRKGKIIWDEFQPDPRWTHRSFSDIVEYDIEKKKRRKITKNTRYSSPSFSFSGDSIVAVETSLSNDFSLVILSSVDGSIMDKIPSPANIQLLHPAWKEDDSGIIVIGLDQNGKSLHQYDLSTRSWTELLYTREVNISNPRYAGDYILLTGSFSGVDNIYAFNPEEEQLYKLTRSELGAFEPDVSVDHSAFAFADYSSKGYNISVKELDDFSMEAFSRQEVTEQPFFRYGDFEKPPQEPWIRDIPDTIKSEKFSKPKNLFNFHSWAPLYTDLTDPELENPEINPGITLLSQNELSTAVAAIGYEYKDNDHYFHTNFIYSGFYPIFELSYRLGGLPAVVSPDPDIPQPEKVRTSSNISLNTYIPFSYRIGKWVAGMQPSLEITYANDYFYYVQDRSFNRGIVYTEPRLYLYTYQRTALRDLQPRFGLIVDLQSISAPFEDEQRGSNNSIRTALYLPGFLRSHGIRLKAEWEHQQPERYLFGNFLSYPRGYDPLIFMGANKYTADYVFPVMYPELNLEGLLYLKRIRGGVFTDYLIGKEVRILNEDQTAISEIRTGSYQSSGMELIFDYHILRFLAPFSSGVRASWLHGEEEWRFEFLFNIYLDRF